MTQTGCRNQGKYKKSKSLQINETLQYGENIYPSRLFSLYLQDDTLEHIIMLQEDFANKKV